MGVEELQLLGATLLSVVNIALLIYQTYKKVPREAEKMQAEREDILGDAAESNLNAAITSNTLLKERIAELKKERRDLWNYIAVLKKTIVQAQLTMPDYDPAESDPKIK